MKNLYFLLCSIAFILSSCAQEFQEKSNSTQKPLPLAKFNSVSDFLDTFDYLANLRFEELKLWVKTNNFDSSIYKSESIQDTLFRDTPIAFQALFNTNLEVQIGESIITYSNGELYSITKNGNIYDKKNYGYAKYDEDSSHQPSTRYSGTSIHGDKQSSRQHEFGINANNYHYKYIHQIRSFTTVINTQTRYALVLDIKMEYKNSGSWKSAGRERTIEYNLNSSCSFGVERGENLYFKTNIPIHYSDGYANIVLFSAKSKALNNRWVYTLTGTVTQEIVGSPESRWIDNF